MAVNSKVPIIVLVVLVVVSLVLAVAGFNLLDKERAKNMSLQDEVDGVKTKLMITEKRIEEHKGTISQLEAQLEEYKKRAEGLLKEIDIEKAAKEEALAMIDKLKIDLGRLKVLAEETQQNMTQAITPVETQQAVTQTAQTAPPEETTVKVSPAQVMPVDTEDEGSSDEEPIE